MQKQVFLKSTGQQVRFYDEAQPYGLRRKEKGFTRIIIPPVRPGAAVSIVRVALNKLRFGPNPSRRLHREKTLRLAH